MKYPFLKLAVASGLLSLGLAAPVRAQNSAVNNAQLSLSANQLDKAMTSINEAIVNEKTKDKAKTWFVRGEVYYRLLDPTTKMLTAKYAAAMQPGEAVQKAAESYRKALELDGPAGEFGSQVVDKPGKPGRLTVLYGMAFNDAVNAYNEALKAEGATKASALDKAIANYRLANTVSPKDTAVLFMAYAQAAKQDYAGARESYNQLLGMGYKTEAVYQQLFQLAQQQNDQAEMHRVLDLALAAYPNNKMFLLQDLNMSMGGQAGGEAALEKITKAISVDPKNSNLYAVRGSIYDQQQKADVSAAEQKRKENPKSDVSALYKKAAQEADLAIADYKKAVELDANNFDAQYNLGIYNFNQAATLYTKASKMDLNTYKLKGKPLEAEGKKYFEASVPYFEKALELKPDDQGALFALQKVYARLNRGADAQRMNDRLQALKR